MNTDAIRPRLLTCAILACGGLLGAFAPAAGAVITHSSSGTFVSIAPRSTVPASGAGRTPATHAASRASSPSTAHFSAAYETLVNQYLTDVGADSGSNTNVYGVTAQYGPSSTFGAPGIYASSFGASIADTTPYPADGVHGNPSGCAPPVAPSSYSWCLTDGQVRNEISSVIASHSLPQDSGAVYFLLLPQGVDECQNGSSVCADNSFCAYHSSFGPASAPNAPLYAVVPYGDVPGCQSGESPNGDPADDTIGLVGHEHNETISDPFGTGWFDGGGNEVADKCIGTFGATQGGAPGAGYNQTINGHHYYLQDGFSNNDQRTCEQRPAGVADGVGFGQDASPLGYHGGPVLGAHATYAIYWDPTSVGQTPSASFAGPTAANVGGCPPTAANPAQCPTFDASASTDPQGSPLSYSWDFGDGTSDSGKVVAHTFTIPGAHTVTLTVTDALGFASSASQSITINAAPAPSFVTLATAFAPGQAVPFDAGASSDADGFITSYAWSFGDGTGASGVKTSHAYAVAGTYTVSLTVTDNSGNSAFVSAPVSIQVGANGGGISGGGTGGGGAGSGAGGLARIASIGSPHALTLDHGVTVVTGQAVRCPATAAHCTVKLSMTTRSGTAVAASRGHKRVAAHTVTIGNAKFTTPGGGSSALAIRLSKLGVHLLSKQRHLRVTITVVSTVSGRAGIKSTQSFTLNAPRDLGRHR